MKNIIISKDKGNIDLDILFNYLSFESYWAKERSLETIKKSIINSTCYSALLNGNFIGFARIITDKSTFAYLADFFILPSYQKQKIGSKLLEFILNDKEIDGVRVYLLTLDGHDFYDKFGFIQDDDLLKRIMRKPIGK